MKEIIIKKEYVAARISFNLLICNVFYCMGSIVNKFAICMGIIMSKRLSKILSTIVVLSMILGTNAFASPSVREAIKVSTNQTWNVRTSVERTRNYSTVITKLYAVYPTNGGTDNFTKLQVQVRNINGTIIGDTITLNEQDSGVKYIKIKEGYLNTSNVVFCFRGNNSDYAAYADIYYAGC